MANYILVHGGRKSGVVWYKVAPQLIAAGHRVFCPTLSDAKYSTLENHIHEVTAIVTEHDLTDVVLVGHSYGGIVITGAADRLPKCFSHLVYVDSALPEPGKSLFDLMLAAGYRFDLGEQVPKYAPYITPLQFSVANINQIKKTYIFCEQSEFASATKNAYLAVKQRPQSENWHTIKMPTTHSPMISIPEEFLHVLIKVSK